MKKLICMLIVTCMVAISMGSVVMATEETLEVWDGTIEAPQGTGTEGDPYLIANGKNLAWLASEVDVNGKNRTYYAKQVKDIIMNDDDDFAYDATTGKVTGLAADAVAGTTVFAFEPIGAGSTGDAAYVPYNGVFDGNGYEIKNLYISTGGFAGLFGANEGTLKNIKITSGFVKATTNYAGAVVGYATGWYNTSSVINCYNNATVSGTQYVAGIVGRSGGSAKNVLIEGCVNEGTITGTANNIGGVVGQLLNYTTVNNCLVSGAITGNLYVGAIAGGVADGTTKYSNDKIVISNSLNVSTYFSCTGTQSAYGAYPIAGNGSTVDNWKGTISNVHSVDCSATSKQFKPNNVWRNSSSNIKLDSFPGCKTAAELATIDMAYLLNTGSSGETYANSGAWTYIDGAAYPTLADSVNGGVYKCEITNGDSSLNADNAYIKSTTGTAKLIVANDGGTNAKVTDVDLKTENTKDIAASVTGAAPKVMLWDSFTTLKPLMGYIIAE